MNLLGRLLGTTALLFWVAGATATEAVLDGARITGVSEDGVLAFKGIPYARAPIAERRWLAPAPAELSGEINGTAFGPICPQVSGAGDPAGQSEDCLTLNVWTESLERQRPVMVWFHGGGFRAGSGNVPGEVFATKGVVFISLNYRLGPLGFLAHDALNSDVANYALLDMIEALRWVKENADTFGGDPDQTTIFGVSAGGMAVELLMSTPGARGLFHQAIAQSGYGTWALPRTRGAPQPAPRDMDLGPPESAESMGSALMGRVIEGEQTAGALRALDAQTVVKALKGFQVPIVDGTSLPEEPGIIFQRGQQARIPFITGGNSYEGSVMPASGISEETFVSWFPNDRARIRTLYAEDFAVSESWGVRRMFGDNRYLLAARVHGRGTAALGSPVWLYYTDFDVAEKGTQPAGTPHGTDGYLIFRGEQLPNRSIRQLSGRLRDYWVNFARTGDPNTVKLSRWSPLGAQECWLVFGKDDEMRCGVIGERLDFLEGRYEQRIAPATLD